MPKQESNTALAGGHPTAGEIADESSVMTLRQGTGSEAEFQKIIEDFGWTPFVGEDRTIYSGRYVSLAQHSGTMVVNFMRGVIDTDR